MTKQLYRWEGIERPYSTNDVKKLSGSVHIEHTLAQKGASKLWDKLHSKKYVSALGALTGNQAMQQAKARLDAIYLSGWQVAGDANDSLQMYPDQSLYAVGSVPTIVKRINNTFQRADQIQTMEGEGAIDYFLPIVADAESGFGGVLNTHELVKHLIEVGAAGVHIEDQVQAKRCGHRPGKQIVSTTEMCDRLKAAADAKEYDDFVLMARTDAIAGEGVDAAIARSVAYVEAGADMIFAEAVTELSDFKKFKDAVGVPLLANLTEFGKTPAFTVEQLASVYVDIALYPLTAFRAANKAAENALRVIRTEGTQQSVVGDLQTRDELYEYLEYHTYESKLDELFDAESNDQNAN